MAVENIRDKVIKELDETLKVWKKLRGEKVEEEKKEEKSGEEKK